MVRNDDKGKIRVFVYGTLKIKHGNHTLLEKARADFVGHDTITGAFQMYDLNGFPALHGAEENHQIKGQIFALPNEEGLAALDYLEGHPNFFRRVKLWSDRLKKRVWVYMLPPRS